jgi:casein kinase II subunit beta
MAEKYALAQFGRCPRVFCLGQPVLPVGRSDLPRNYTVNVYCPMCQVNQRDKSARTYLNMGLRIRENAHLGNT